jgi:glycosyltransferase involved in cell wall biosynthesis
MTNDIGIVAIGRNEGQRLQQCLESLVSSGCPIVYVDSGSTDGSVELAHSLCAAVVELDMSIPFTAARARNEGFAQLKKLHPQIQFVQFLDGDCALDPDWLGKATEFLRQHSQIAVACGRRRERYPDHSVYNRLCDLEWDTPVGEAKACGGDSLMCVAAFEQVAGFNPSVIAGEEPELCVRMRQVGWQIYRLDAEMTLHDAAIEHFSAWWRRCVRAGYAYALGASLHGGKPERHWVKHKRSCIFWSGLLPLITVLLIWPTRGWSMFLLALYPLQWVRIFRGQLQRGRSGKEARLLATFLLIAKFAEFLGTAKFFMHRMSGRQAVLIEYKRAPDIAPPRSKQVLEQCNSGSH